MKAGEITTDKEKVEEFLDRAIENIFPNKEELKKRLLSGDKLSFYLGIDPTGPSVHLGHVVPILALKRLQDMGHGVILLIGDFTATIGDPSDRGAARKQLSRKEVLENLKGYKKQISKIIKFSGNNKARIVFNSKWLAKMNFEKVLELAATTTVDQMLKRDMFEKRVNENKPIYLHEFLYPLMQGYDSVALNVDGEIGGNDQTFNMLTGRDLLKTYKNKEKFVVTTKLLIDQNGKKMSKTEGNMVSLSDTPNEIFGKVMSWADGIIISTMKNATLLPSSEIIESENRIKTGSNPKEEKVKLAKALIGLCFGKKEAEEAAENFQKTFSEKEMPVNAETIELSNKNLIDEIIYKKIVESKSELKRLADAGAITNFTTGEKIAFENLKDLKNVNLRIGKHRFVKVT